MLKRIITLLVLLPCSVLLVGAGETTIEQAVAAIDMLWLILSASLVFFMQAGFALVETGLTRSTTETGFSRPCSRLHQLR